MRRLRILISAYACEPGKGSEPGVGWNVAWEIARYHDVWVITRANNRSAIEAAVVESHPRVPRFVYFDLPAWARWWKRGQRGVQLYYYLWQLGALFVCRRLHRQVGFDLVHHVTLVKYWAPSFLALLPVPFVWGPVGGGESAPRRFWPTFSIAGFVYEVARDVARWVGERDPFVRLTARRSAVALATTDETACRMRILGARKVYCFAQSALPCDELERLHPGDGAKAAPARFVSVGRHLSWKGFHLALRAFALAAIPECEYVLIGDGPERRRLEGIARRLSVSDRVEFLGQLPREQVFQRLRESDVLVHPSLHDSGGWVCIEAMAAGKPVLCVDLGGPVNLVSGGAGIVVPADSPERVVLGLAAAMRQLARDPGLRKAIGAAARSRAEEKHNWRNKGQELECFYQRALGIASTRGAPGDGRSPASEYVGLDENRSA